MAEISQNDLPATQACNPAPPVAQGGARVLEETELAPSPRVTEECSDCIV